MKFAVTTLGESIVTMQVPVPVQSPLQPVKTLPGAGNASTGTGMPWDNFSEQSAPQEIPNVLTTEPYPFPARNNFV